MPLFTPSIHAIEHALKLHYPSSAPEFFAALQGLLDKPLYRRTFPTSDLLDTPLKVAAARAKMPATLLPFLHQPPDYYAFDLQSPGARRVVAWADHAIVADWPDCAHLVQWMNDFLEKGTPYNQRP